MELPDSLCWITGVLGTKYFIIICTEKLFSKVLCLLLHSCFLNFTVERHHKFWKENKHNVLQYAEYALRLKFKYDVYFYPGRACMLNVQILKYILFWAVSGKLDEIILKIEIHWVSALLLPRSPVPSINVDQIFSRNPRTMRLDTRDTRDTRDTCH